MDDDLKFKYPFTSIVSGPTGSGKWTFCISLLQNRKLLCTEQEFNGGIFWCFGDRTAVPDRSLSELNNTIRVHKGVPENFENKNGKPCLIILDDLLDVAYSKEVCNLFTKGSHHRNISVILITQNLFHQANYCREISLNAKYLVLLKNVRDNQKFMCLARQVQLYKVYLEAIKNLDFAQDTDDRLRFRTHIFPDEYPPTFYVELTDDETDKIELLRPSSTQIGTAQIKESHTFKRKPRTAELYKRMCS